jgi:hypothetical protein
VLVGLEGLFVVVLGVLELFALNAGRVMLGVTTGLFFALVGAGLASCAVGLLRAHSWARGPVVAVELIGVLLSFSFWGGETRLVAAIMLLVSLAVLAGLLHPASTRALAANDG